MGRYGWVDEEGWWGLGKKRRRDGGLRWRRRGESRALADKWKRG